MNISKTVIVTGASSGLGYAITKAYLDRGYNVVGNGRSLERLQDAAAKLGNPKNFLFVSGDISKLKTAADLFSKAIEHFGKVDILVNNAGIFISKPVVNYTESDLDSIIETNLKGFFYPSQVVAKHMAKNGSGHIVTITASIAMQPSTQVPALLPVMVKGGLNSAIKGLALELAPSNVMVNGVAPGIIATPMHSPDEQVQAVLKNMAPTGRLGAAKDIVDAVLYLTDSSFVTGTVLTVDGGSTSGHW